jgi:hypothetical protein
LGLALATCVLKGVELRLIIEFLFALATSTYLRLICLRWRLIDLHELRLKLRPLVTITLIHTVMGPDSSLKLVVKHVFTPLVLGIIVLATSVLQSPSK